MKKGLAANAELARAHQSEVLNRKCKSGLDFFINIAEVALADIEVVRATIFEKLGRVTAGSETSLGSLEQAEFTEAA